MPISMDAQEIVRRYSAESMVAAPETSLERKILDRLANDQSDRVAPAMARLKPADNQLVLFYLIQAVDLASSQNEIVRTTSELAIQFRRSAENTRKLADFCREQVSIALWINLPQLADELDERADFFEAKPRDLKISRKRKDVSAEQLLAIRHFVHKLRKQLQIKVASAPQKQAVQWLIEVALDCTIPDGRLAEGLRHPINGN